MSPKMYIPVTITLTETEYLAVQNFMKGLCIDDQQVSAVMRFIIRDWLNLKELSAQAPKLKSLEFPGEGEEAES